MTSNRADTILRVLATFEFFVAAVWTTISVIDICAGVSTLDIAIAISVAICSFIWGYLIMTWIGDYE